MSRRGFQPKKLWGRDNPHYKGVTPAQSIEDDIGSPDKVRDFSSEDDESFDDIPHDNSLYDIPETWKVADAISGAGYQPMLVGGIVRDSLLGRESKDIDIEVHGGCSYEELTNILRQVGNVDVVGKSFAVAKVTINKKDFDVSIPCKDSKTSDGHKGFSVKTDSAMTHEEAASRRDFTINSIMIDLQEDKIIDPYHGVDDINTRTLRVVDAQKFGEDPLRAFRAARFASTLNMEPDNELKNIVTNMNISDISGERIWGEMEKIFNSEHPEKGLAFMKDTAITQRLSMSIPENIHVGKSSVPTWVAATHVPKMKGIPQDIIKESKFINSIAEAHHQGADVYKLMDMASQSKYNANDAAQLVKMRGYKPLPNIPDIPEVPVNGNDIMEYGFAGRDVGRMKTELQKQFNRGILTTSEDAHRFLQ